jgi:hypothetical protein
MKNKKFTTLLLICVAILWGIIFYRIFLAMDESPQIIKPINTKKMKYFNAINHVNDKVNLKLDYRDPFSVVNTVVYKEEEPPKPNKITIPPPIAPKPQVNWTNVLYKGYINNTSIKQNLVILIANGKEFMLKEGQTLNGIKLIKYAGDSIKIQYQNCVKYIKLR